MTGGDAALRQPLFASMIAAGALEGAIFVARNDKDEIVSVGLAFGPGRIMFGRQVPVP